MINIVELSHELLNEFNNPQKAIDMTCGRGNDTLFLANISKEVYAFDIQDEAISSTKSLLDDHNISNVSIFKESHDLFDIYVSGEVDLVIYNLGYLPSSNKAIKTDSNIVITSLEKVLKFLSNGGIVVIVIYLHDLFESDKINEFVKGLGKGYDVMKYEVLNKNKSPYIIKIQKVC